MDKEQSKGVLPDKLTSNKGWDEEEFFLSLQQLVRRHHVSPSHCCWSVALLVIVCVLQQRRLICKERQKDTKVASLEIYIYICSSLSWE